MPHRIALVGGTGPEGRGLATRFAMAGHHVTIGSRGADRGTEVAAELAESLKTTAPGATTIDGTDNATAIANADLVVVVVPYAAHQPTLEGLSEALAGKIVVDAVVPVYFERGPRPVEVEAGSATEEAATLLPDSRVIGAFHNLSAEKLLEPDTSLDADVLITGGDTEAKQLVTALANEIAGVRAIDAGPLRYSRFIEDLTILLIGINGRYKTHSGIKITGINTGANE
jgi:NADPH-dependent F420 reductase